MAGHVIDRLQVQQRNNEVVFIPRRGRYAVTGKSIHMLDLYRPIGAEQSGGKRFRVRADQNSVREIPLIGAQPVGEIIQYQIADKIVLAETAGAISGNLELIEKRWWAGHRKGLSPGPWHGNMALMESGDGEVKGQTMGARLGKGLGRFGIALLDQLYPPCCVVCGAPLAMADALCSDCFCGLRPISAPLCPVLGLPFDSDPGPGALCAEALADPPPFGRARAAFAYGEVASSLISRLKYGDRVELARFCARLMVAAGSDFWASKPVLLPVPLHHSRLRFRRYNQSMLLAQEIGRLTGLRVDPHLAARSRETRQQVGLSGDGRLRNVQGAFAAHPRALERLGGRPVVVVDDVYTTGATVKALTRVLKRSGAETVDVLTFARVVISGELPI
jgi:ComF family protein